MKVHQVRGGGRAGVTTLARDILYRCETSVREPLVPQEEFLLSKSQMLVGSS
jgi:hypothetical protein